MQAAMIANIFEHAVNRADDAALPVEYSAACADSRWDFRRRP
jgi:hypothetical protein